MSAELLEELQVLESIFSDSVTNETNAKNTVITYRHDEPNVIATFSVSDKYPSAAVPQLSLSFADNALSKRKFEIESIVYEVIAEGNGEVVLYNAIQALRDILDGTTDPTLTEDGNEEGYLEGDYKEDQHKQTFRDIDHSGSGTASHLKVIHGPVSEVSKSTFQSHAAVVHSMADVALFKEIVLSDKKTARATHNIFAYRFIDPTTGIVYHDNDDDGETAAGARLGELLRLMNIQNYAVIVSRVFGGTKLGPHRFKYINNSARKLLEDTMAGGNGIGID